MIEINGLKHFTKLVASLSGFLKDEVKQVKARRDFIKDFRLELLPEILNTAGSNIDDPFKDKKTLEWKKYRKFNVPTGWYRGIWTGETYYALWTGKSTENVGIQQLIERDYIEYGYDRDDGATPYINFNLGFTDKFLEEQEEKYKNRVEAILNKKITAIENAKYNEKVVERDF